jgi:hypothetical protein
MVIASMAMPFAGLVINMTPVFIRTSGVGKSCGAGDCENSERDKFFHLLLLESAEWRAAAPELQISNYTVNPARARPMFMGDWLLAGRKIS